MAYSFNHPAGACPECTGLGTSMVLDEDSLFDLDRSIAEGGILFSQFSSGWQTVYWQQNPLLDPNKPLCDFTDEEWRILKYEAPKDVVMQINSNNTGGDPYFHDQMIWCDDTPDSKVQMNVWHRELGLRVHAARKARMRRLSYEWLAGLREIVIDPKRCPLIFSEFTLKEFERDKEGNWIDDIPDGQDYSIDAVRYALMDDVLRG